MMTPNIDVSMPQVNRSVYLIENRNAYRLQSMKYGERLRAARKHKGITQAELAEAAGLKQPSVSHLEDPRNDVEGSAYTVQFARACGVSPDWLADEIGEMLPTAYTITDPQIIAIAMMLQQEQVPYLVDKVQKDLASDIELLRAAGEARKKGNG